MRHRKKGNALGRKSAHKKAMMSNMACSLIEHKRITTTVAKAKELRMFVEPLITKSKLDSTHSRRIVFSNLKSKDAVSSLFRDVAPKVATREGGYTRIIKLGTRHGDAAEMCMIELVDFNELMLQDAKSKTRRSRRGKKKSTETAAKAAPAETVEGTDIAEAAPASEEATAETVGTPEVQTEEAVEDKPKGEIPEASADDADSKDDDKKEAK